MENENVEKRAVTAQFEESLIKSNAIQTLKKEAVDLEKGDELMQVRVGPFAVSNGLVDPKRIPENGIAVVRIFQVNIQKTIIAHVPVCDGEVQETGDHGECICDWLGREVILAPFISRID